MPATAHIPDTCRGPRPLLRSRASGPQHHESTVHRDGLAGDEARILAREKQQHGSQILQRIAQRAAQRYALLQVRGDAGEHQVEKDVDLVYLTGSGGVFSVQSAAILGSEPS